MTMASTQLAKRSQKDALDSFFEFTERLMCPIDDGDNSNNKMKNRRAKTQQSALVPNEPDEDLLDYTFNAVESFTCVDDGGRSGRDGHYHNGYPRHGGPAPSEPSYLTRDNSLVESLPGNAGGPPSSSSRAIQKRRTNRDGDVIDYVFEHVESFVCADDMPNNHNVDTIPTHYTPVGGEIRVPAAVSSSTTNSSSSRMSAKKNTTSANLRNVKRYQEEIYEPDDEIQLFFRPRR